MVMVGDEDVAALRTLLDGDWDGFGRMLYALDHPGPDRRFGVLLVTTAGWAARIRFENGWSRADVLQYAEDVRDRSVIRGLPLITCETQLLCSLENRRLPSPEPPDIVTAQFALIMALGGDLETEARGRVMAEARAQADQWLEWYDRYGLPVNGVWETRRRCRDAEVSSGFGRPGRCRVGRRRHG